MLSEAVQAVQDAWEVFFPPVATPEERIAEAQARLKAHENALQREEWTMRARMARCERDLAVAGKTRDEAEIRRAARTKVAAERQRGVLEARLAEMQTAKESVMQMRTDQVNTSAVLDVMAAVAESSLDPLQATRTLTRYAMVTQQGDLVAELVRDALQERAEEKAEASEAEAAEDDARLEELVAEQLALANQELLARMPPINARSVSPAILGAPRQQLVASNREAQRKLDLYLAQEK